MKVLFLSQVWPEPDSSAAGLRTLTLARNLRDADNEVFFAASCSDNDYRQALTRENIKTFRAVPNDQNFALDLSEIKPDFVLFDRFMVEEQFSWQIQSLLPSALRILDTVELHFLREARQGLCTDGTIQNHKIDFCSNLSSLCLRELSAILRSDLSLLTSKFEVDLLQNQFSINPELIAQVAPSYTTCNQNIDFKSRKHLVSIGSFRHPPNMDSAKLLINNLWPRLRELIVQDTGEDIELHIWGSYPTKEVMSWDSPKTGLRIRGKLEDISSLRKYRVSLAPLRYGAGIKGKIADSWVYGTPCVSTDIGAEGMCEREEFGGALANTFDDYLEATRLLYSNEIAWDTAQRKGSDILAKNFCPRQNAMQFISLLQNVLLNCDTNRKKNFVGQILWHQGMRSTEYFSRWIQEKNKSSGILPLNISMSNDG